MPRQFDNYCSLLDQLTFAGWTLYGGGMRKKLPKSTLIEGHATVGGVVYRQKVVRYTQQPCMFKYSHQTEIITGIAFVPLSSKYQSPEGDVIEGGVNWNNVTICRTTVQNGRVTFLSLRAKRNLLRSRKSGQRWRCLMYESKASNLWTKTR